MTFLLRCCIALSMLEWCWSLYFFRLMLIYIELRMQASRNHLRSFYLWLFLWLLNAGAALLQCWCFNIFKIMVGRDMICIWDIFTTLETQYFYFCLTQQPSCCSAAQLSSCWSDAVHHISWDYGWFVQISRTSSFGHKLVAFLLLVIAGAGLLQCWYSNFILRIMTDRDIICIKDKFMIFKQYFDSCLTERPSCSSVAWYS